MSSTVGLMWVGTSWLAAEFSTFALCKLENQKYLILTKRDVSSMKTLS